MVDPDPETEWLDDGWGTATDGRLSLSLVHSSAPHDLCSQEKRF